MVQHAKRPGELRRRGVLLVMTGASGVGKDTIRAAALPQLDNLYYSISMTTREQRPGEVDGVNYHYLSMEQFETHIENDAFVEWAEYVGDYYGTPIAPVEAALERGEDVLLELELVGARQVMRRMPEAVKLFIAPPSMTELESRLRGRGTDSEERIQRRLERAREEILAIPEFDYLIVNEEVDQAVHDFLAIIHAERRKTHLYKSAELTAILER